MIKVWPDAADAGLRLPAPASRTVRTVQSVLKVEAQEAVKGEASLDLSRFLCFGKEGVLRGRDFGDQVHTFSCL